MPDKTTVWLARARAGDEVAKNWLAQRFSPLLLAHAIDTLGTAGRPEVDPYDVVSWTLELGLRRMGELRARDGRLTPVLMAFLCTILDNRMRQLVRPRSKRGVEVVAVPEVLDAAARGAGSSPLDALIRAEDVARVLAAITDLDALDRRILIERYLHERSSADVAAELGLSVSNLNVRCHRARAQLRGRFSDSVFDDL